MDARGKITKARINMLLNYAFFGILSLRLQLVEDSSVPTAGTDGKKLYYNPKFIDDMSDNDIIFIILHEVMHCALRHIWRQGTRDKHIFNMACDYAIHSIIDSDSGNNMTIPKFCLFDKKFNGMSAEQIYDIIVDNPKHQQMAQQMKDMENGNGNGKSGHSNSPLMDDHSKWGKAANGEEESQAQKSAQQQDWEAAVINAAKQVANDGKQAGSVPGYFKRLIKDITEPTKDWRILLREFIEPEPNDYTFTLPDYRLDYDTFGCFLPSFNDEDETVSDIYFWVDTSGSISDFELNKIYSEVAGAVNQFDTFKGYLGFFDSVAYEPKEFNDINSLKEIKPEGGGGTNFHAPFKYIEKNNLKPKAIIMLTDGYCDFPDETITDVPVIWLITTKEIEAPWGKNIYLDLAA